MEDDVKMTLIRFSRTRAYGKINARTSPAAREQAWKAGGTSVGWSLPGLREKQLILRLLDTREE